MTTTLRTAFAWHRPLMALAAAMLALTAVGIVGMVVDDRVLTGLPIWDKPTKFAISIAVYSVAWAWLISQLRVQRRRAWWAGTVAGAFLAVEIVVIVTQVVRGTTSHFNNATTFDGWMWRAMGISIVIVWLATLYVCAQLFRRRDGDPARTLAIRVGSVLALIGMALGFLMTTPTAAQIAEGGDIIGAHSVGLADGGPGLPLLGWSTVGGDLRIPHFVGMHALQAIPLVLIALELLAPRVTALASSTVRRRLVWVATGAYTGLLTILTWQALRGQSVVAPDAATLAAAATVVVATVVATLVVLRHRPPAPEPAVRSDPENRGVPSAV
ncbi:hypothetical protein PSU4_09610 [Pseudonocardia sulfidoxydans NBRC 16205]|uniref:Uncharacterized protein n=1 Tax=Pseudonocardia sulfidoxydans NBRC 16205 TaxID=1223511 RepID=A0A511DBR3_9PSEU|nr:aquaporin [Pseudonocardia sulfidoxydans]GEL22007.1 hypothetical protein PSU4_09610 [Pseudonocardia sulfidoxydans NBRC 16205]